MTEPQPDIELLLQAEKGRLSQKIEEAMKNAPRIQIVDGDIVNEEHQMKMETTDEVPPGMAHISWAEKANEVYLNESNSHLFPWLYSEALKRLGIEITEGKVENVAGHEFLHLVKAQRLEKVKSIIGLSFYKVTSINGKALPQEANAVQPSVSITGECLIEEFAEIIKAPEDDMSVGDKKDLDRLRKLTNRN
jgi:hypothetical protein